MRPGLATVLVPPRADLFRRSEERSTQPASQDHGDLSLTVTIEDRTPRVGRRFSFRAARRTDEAAAPTEPRAQTMLITDDRDSVAAVLARSDARSSARFLAGAIAQACPATMLHNPPYRQATGAYRRSDGLGTEDKITRSEKV